MTAEFTATASRASLREIRSFMEAELARMGVREQVTHQLVLAVDEACANSIIHQHAEDGVSRIRITLRRDDGILTIELHDTGEPFPIDEYKPDEDMENFVRNRAKGGLGLLLITRIMDKVEVIRKRGGFTYRFVKRVG